MVILLAKTLRFPTQIVHYRHSLHLLPTYTTSFGLTLIKASSATVGKYLPISSLLLHEPRVLGELQSSIFGTCENVSKGQAGAAGSKDRGMGGAMTHMGNENVSSA